MAYLRPELFHAYVGVSQLVGPAHLAASHALALQRARELGDQPAVAALQGLRADLADRLAAMPETGASCPLRP